jgi:heme A synthase
MQSLRRLSLLALVLAFAQIVFGAIVRITGSGMGCGDHWPKCAGLWFPPYDRIDLIIEITHRYIALGLSLAILALVIVAVRHRSETGVGGPGGVLKPAIIAGLLVVTAALLGAVTVKMALNPFVIATHLTIAMSLLATLAIALSRAGGVAGASDLAGTSLRAFRSARGAVILTLIVLVFGALTANVPDAASSCGGFPWCRTITAGGAPLAIQNAVRFALGAAILQVIVAAGMIEMHFPPAFRSLHQAFGTLVWLAVVIVSILATRGTHSERAAAPMRKAA